MHQAPVRLLCAALAALAASGLAAAPRARADVVPGFDGLLRPGQRFSGDVQPEETIRFTVELAKGAKLRANIKLQSPVTGLYIPSNFQRVSVTDVTHVADILQDPGVPVAFDMGQDASARYDSIARSSTFFVTDWKAPSGGRFQFAVTHKTKVITRCTGRVTATRRRTKSFKGTLESLAADRTFAIPMQPDDNIRANVRRVKAGKTPAPQFVALTEAGATTPYTPGQKRSKTGSAMRPVYAYGFGDALLTIGAQGAGTPKGAFKGTITLTPGGPYGKVPMSVVNSPGVPVSVRSLDAFVSVPWAVTGCGIAWDGVFSYILVTGEQSGAVKGKYYDLALVDPNPFSLPAPLVTSADLPGTDTVKGHRLMFNEGRFYVGYSSGSGNAAGLVRIDPVGLVRDGAATMPPTGVAANPTNDLFLAHDDFSVFVGLPLSNGHDVYGFDTGSMASLGPPQRIGGIGTPHSGGGSAVYRRDQNLFEFWAPTTLTPGSPSDLHHGLYTNQWILTSWQASRVAEDSVVEQMCSSVVVDEASGTTFLHYVVPTSGNGLGIVHRRHYDALGNEVPDSHATLGSVPYNRPTAMVIGNFLYVAVEGASNSSVIRYQLLRR